MICESDDLRQQIFCETSLIEDVAKAIADEAVDLTWFTDFKTTTPVLTIDEVRAKLIDGTCCQKLLQVLLDISKANIVRHKALVCLEAFAHHSDAVEVFRRDHFVLQLIKLSTNTQDPLSAEAFDFISHLPNSPELYEAFLSPDFPG